MFVAVIGTAKLLPSAAGLMGIDIAGYVLSPEFRSVLANFISAFLVGLASLLAGLQGAM